MSKLYYIFAHNSIRSFSFRSFAFDRLLSIFGRMTGRSGRVDCKRWLFTRIAPLSDTSVAMRIWFFSGESMAPIKPRSDVRFRIAETHLCILAECSKALRLLSISVLSFLLSVYSAAFSFALLSCSYCMSIIRSCHLCMPSSSSLATLWTWPVCRSRCKLIGIRLIKDVYTVLRAGPALGQVDEDDVCPGPPRWRSYS